MGREGWEGAGMHEGRLWVGRREAEVKQRFALTHWNGFMRVRQKKMEQSETPT